MLAWTHMWKQKRRFQDNSSKPAAECLCSPPGPECKRCPVIPAGLSPSCQVRGLLPVASLVRRGRGSPRDSGLPSSPGSSETENRIHVCPRVQVLFFPLSCNYSLFFSKLAIFIMKLFSFKNDLWSKKMIQMNLFTKQKQTHRVRKQTYGY